MSYEPTPEEVERVAYAIEWSDDVSGDPARDAIRAFVPEGTVPVFLTREELAVASISIKEALSQDYGDGHAVLLDLGDKLACAGESLLALSLRSLADHLTADPATCSECGETSLGGVDPHCAGTLANAHPRTRMLTSQPKARARLLRALAWLPVEQRPSRGQDRRRNREQA